MLARCSCIRGGRLSRNPINLKTKISHVVRPDSVTCRYASTTSAAPPHATGASQASVSPLAAISDELKHIAPRFEIEADDVQILRDPSDFYATLKTKILNAKSRIYLATLYIGKTEHELISTLQTTLRNNPELTLSILTDALRGTRETPEPTTASLLAPLIREFGAHRVQVRMFHTPNLTGLRKRLIPKRINEGWGLQHMKLYGVDDEIILSGANLSNDYFTNRLDRYHLFKSKEITDYFKRIHDAVCGISFDVQPSAPDVAAGYEIDWPAQNKGRVPSPLEDPKGYRQHAAALLSSLIKAMTPPVAAIDDGEAVADNRSGRTPVKATNKTTIYPIFQLTPFFKDHPDESTELPAITHLLSSLKDHPTRTTFTAGYFNPSSSLVSLLLSAYQSRTTPPSRDSTSQTPDTSSSTTVIAASPWANGFYGSKGISGLLPPAYTLLCRRFLQEVQNRGLGDRVKLLEWRKGTVGTEGGWTYHAKGIWVTLLGQRPQSQRHGQGDVEADAAAGPSITLIGSSNYTQRSYTLDLEANALVLTTDEGLQRRLKEEEEWLRADAREVGLDEYMKTERRVGLHVRIAMWITKLVGGAL